LWLNNAYLGVITSTFFKITLFPIIAFTVLLIGYFVFNNLSSMMGRYGDVDGALEQAKIIQTDLLREDQYGANNYDLGEIDGSILGLIKVAPTAVFTALFRPLFWEVGSPTMFISAIENTFLIVFSLFTFLTVSPIKFLRLLLKEPFLLYCLTFSIIFAFGVGIAGTNFGALVRYKIPLIPFFFPMLYLFKNKLK